jgi:hypothetical protein
LRPGPGAGFAAGVALGFAADVALGFAAGVALGFARALDATAGLFFAPAFDATAGLFFAPAFDEAFAFAPAFDEVFAFAGTAARAFTRFRAEGRAPAVAGKPRVGLAFARAIGDKLTDGTDVAYFFGAPNMPSAYSTISP